MLVWMSCMWTDTVFVLSGQWRKKCLCQVTFMSEDCYTRVLKIPSLPARLCLHLTPGGRYLSRLHLPISWWETESRKRGRRTVLILGTWTNDCVAFCVWSIPASDRQRINILSKSAIALKDLGVKLLHPWYNHQAHVFYRQKCDWAWFFPAKSLPAGLNDWWVTACWWTFSVYSALCALDIVNHPPLFFFLTFFNWNWFFFFILSFVIIFGNFFVVTHLTASSKSAFHHGFECCSCKRYKMANVRSVQAISEGNLLALWWRMQICTPP